MSSLQDLMNSTFLWIIASIVITIVIVQGFIFMNLSRKVAPKVGLSKTEVRTALRTGFISSLGPSIAVAIVIISLITLIGSPLTMLRIGIIGSAATETAAANIGATAFGTDLSSDSFGLKAFVVVVWTMCIGGIGWLVFTTLFTKSLSNIQTKVKKTNPKLIPIISLAAMLGAFGYLAGEQMVSNIHFGVATFTAIISMMSIMIYADISKKAWIKEWALGIAMLIGMCAGTISSII